MLAVILLALELLEFKNKNDFIKEVFIATTGWLLNDNSLIYLLDMVAVRATVNRPDSRSAREFREEYTNKHFAETTFGRKTR